MQLFDTHCHLDLEAFDEDRARVLAAARKAGVSDLLIPGIAQQDWGRLVALCDSDAGLHAALGLHPVFINRHTLAHVDELEDWIVRHRPVAVGEIGLDFRPASPDRTRQRILLEAQLDVASRHSLPVILHLVKAHEDMLRILSDFELPGGICHAYSGSLQQAERFIAQGFKLGFGGMLTFERSSRLRKLASALPVESLVLETDAPDMPGVAHRYRRNSPAYLPEVLQVMARLRDRPEHELAGQLLANSRGVLALTQTA